MAVDRPLHPGFRRRATHFVELLDRNPGTWPGRWGRARSYAPSPQYERGLDLKAPVGSPPSDEGADEALRIETAHADARTVTRNQEIEKPSLWTRSNSSPACSSTFPSRNQHSILYYGHYARRTKKPTGNKRQHTPDEDNELDKTQRKSIRRRWANLIRRVFKTDPLICQTCGGNMRIVSFITQPNVIRQILDHLEKRNSRDPPRPSDSVET